MLVLNAKIFLEFVCYAAFTILKQKILKCWYVYHMYTLQGVALQIMIEVKNSENSEYLLTMRKRLLKCIVQWHESEPFCGFLMTILFCKMNDSNATASSLVWVFWNY